MKLSSLFNSGKTVLSFEVFPPKKTSPVETVYKTLDELASLTPDFISVTYGASGSNAGAENNAANTTLNIAAYIQNDLKIPSVAHLTCVYSTKEGIKSCIEAFAENKIENILALRGDINPEFPRKHDFEYASDLVRFIKQNGDFCVSGACYPECHLEAKDLRSDIRNLKTKVEAGAEHLVTQLFFDNAIFYSFAEKLEIAGIDVPVEAGIMPVVNKKQIERMVSLCGASLPAKFTKMLQKYEHNPEALRDAGLAYAIDQIADLISNGVSGIHLYTMNNPLVAKRITDSIRSLL
ncbi:MAG: methylenetetrahydrofolate reductase [NAD(P)H] [Oscillospiraceae bacterium]|nr:methylenetetrahydrofolate reductase [NAD(P)H] [Oscillospiraceae bacterium]